MRNMRKVVMYKRRASVVRRLYKQITGDVRTQVWNELDGYVTVQVWVHFAGILWLALVPRNENET